VLVEKPLAPSATETERLLGEARAAGRLLCPVHQLLFQRGVQRVLSRLPSRAAVRHVDVVACSAGAEGRTGADRTEVALEILPHALALVARLLPDAAAAVAWQVASSPGELRLTAQVGQTSAGILISMSGRPTRNTLRVITDRGTRHLDLFHGFSVAERAWTSRAYKVARPFALALGTWSVGGANLLARTARREWAYPGLRELVRAFYRAAGGDGPPPIPEHETLLVGRWWDRIVHAVRTEHDSVAGA
jgi:predicted dehydrogenase